MAKNCLVFITVFIGQSEGLPNITGEFGLVRDDYATTSNGAFSVRRADIGIGGSGGTTGNVTFNAAKSNAIYGNSTHVTPSNLSIKIWQRIS
ncbi:MAG: hypothetical protein IIW71_00105 [Treponema sp.]|nr:hypothetical protein [Treponema sp.]